LATIFGEFIYLFTGTRGFSSFSIVNTLDEGIKKIGLIFNSNSEGVC
jgi:hypothetical protein